ncbi:MAG: PKD domain-containing protein [Bacteroidetes bacterium]|nr:MAG: PKD domain-containing protein [Bacteroidota bacterium]
MSAFFFAVPGQGCTFKTGVLFSKKRPIFFKTTPAIIMKRTVLTFLCFAFLFSLKAQTEYLVLLHTGEQIWAENARTYADEAFISAYESIDGKYYRFLQFYQIPDQQALKALDQQGIELLEYIPNKTYIAALPTNFDVRRLPDLGVRSIMPIVPELKMRYDLLSDPLPDWAVKGDRIELMFKYYKNLRHDAVLDYCRNDGVRILAENGYNNALKISIPKNRIEDFARQPYVAFVEPVPEPAQKEDIEGRSLHRANMIDTEIPSGRHYDGEGIGVVCRDDGLVGPHIDFQGRIDVSFVGPDRGTHGDGVSGIMAGAGNLNPRNRGMAAGADLWVIDYEPEFLDETMDLFFNHNAIITNSSYSNGCNAGYTIITETVDMQLWENQTLLHVFSAGNSNNNNCGYGAGNQWGNITGGHKQAKNCIATANLFADASLVNSSSRGPAHDGRLKPDIAANGQDQISTSTNNSYQTFGGTSGAAPGIAGIAAMLQDAHKELNNGELAPAPLIKAILLNTANDLGNPGPDFKFGWGHVNAFRAARTLEQNHYFSAEIMPGDTNTHTINIPAGVVQARVMVYWADPPATEMTTKALINDLDIKMTGPQGGEYLPWLLDPTPDPAILDLPATHGNDHLNNMEQVAIDNPTAGDYTLQVAGFELPFGAKEYFVVYEFRTSEITVVYPNGGEHLVPGEMERIHWDAEGNDGLFQIFYSTDDGATWTFIEGVVGEQRMTMWEVPDSISGTALVRVGRAGEVDQSDAHFSIMPLVSGVKVDHACPDYLRISWEPQPAATSYDVHLLGDKYMEVLGNTVDTFYDVPTIDLNPTLDHWYAVSAREDNLGAVGRRTLAQHWNSGLFNCASLVNDIGIYDIEAPGSTNILGCSELDAPVTIALINNGSTAQSGFEVGYMVENQPAVVEVFTGTIMPGQIATHTFAQNLTATTNGSFSFDAWVNLATDEAAFNNSRSLELNLVIYPGAGAALGYSEDFENADFPPAYYAINNFDFGVTWENAEVTGIDGNVTNCASLPNRFFSNPGERDELTTQPIELGDDDNVVLTFDLAYTTRGGTSDSLEVWISDDCGFSFQFLGYKKGGPDFITAPTTNGVFTPAAPQQWRTESVSLADFKNKSVVFKFVNINNSGNNLYIDNINVKQIAPPVAVIDASKTEVCVNRFVVFNAASTGDFVSNVWDFGPNASPNSATKDGPNFVKFNQPGIQIVTLTATNGAGTNVDTIEINVIDEDPVAGFTFDIQNGTVQFTNTSTAGSEFLWDFGDGNTSTEENPTHAYNDIGQFDVTLSVENDCGDDQISQTLDIMVGTRETSVDFTANLFPNPTDGSFQIALVAQHSEDLTIEILDLRGRTLQSANLRLGNTPLTRRFDADTWAAGVYFVKITGRSGTLTRRLVVQ